MPTTAPVATAAIPTTGNAAAKTGVEAANAVVDNTAVVTPTPPEAIPPTAPAMSKPLRTFVAVLHAGE